MTSFLSLAKMRVKLEQFVVIQNTQFYECEIYTHNRKTNTKQSRDETNSKFSLKSDESTKQSNT